MPSENISELVRKWIEYARANGIMASSKSGGERRTISDGRPPEDSDLKAFLKDEGFDERVIDRVVDELPEVEPEDVPEPEQKPSNNPYEVPDDAAPAQRQNIEVGTRAKASDGNTYKWMGMRWHEAVSGKAANQDTANELNQIAQQQQAKPPEPERPPEQEPEPTAVSKDELADVANDISPQEDKNKRKYLRQIRTAISGLNKAERRYLKRLLQ